MDAKSKKTIEIPVKVGMDVVVFIKESKVNLCTGSLKENKVIGKLQKKRSL
ncbi:hypothetical protein [Bacillus thuringiensis]|uniref:hypothetical protein n=1 Tax=Bacillus thuringiensis TaxID=1428 RepID=UPI0015CF7544|nr:hypothetical protein [Bacillus thuringiensis]